MAGGSLIRWIIGKMMRLPRRKTGRISVETGIRVPMRDGVALIADRYFVPGEPNAPLVLIRTCYGRSSMFGIIAGLFAERGLQVLVQSTRGTAGSEGEFLPMCQERDDGADSIDWIKGQDWFPGTLFTFGMSYLGNVQWAAAMDRADDIDGMSLGVTLSNFRDEFLGFGPFTQAGMLTWTQTMLSIVGIENAKLKRRRPPPLAHHHGHLPVGTLDEAALGKVVPWWREWTAHGDRDDPHWHAYDFSPAVIRYEGPALMTAGWNDIFLPFQLKDFEARQALGKPTWLTIGPWSHASPGGSVHSLREAVIELPKIAAGAVPNASRDKVRLYVNGAKEWREYPSWPPPGGEAVCFHLDEEERLSAEAAKQGCSHYVYDPSNPTPAIHGPALMGGSKLRDMSALEARNDTLSFTSAALLEDMVAIGPVTVELAIRSDRVHTDFYACLCDVDLKGRPIQISDGILRLKSGSPKAEADGTRQIRIECWPTAWRVKRGHRLRLIIGSGAHPRYNRNPGTGEPLATATTLLPARQEVRHAGSSIILNTYK